jgi:hypothetical protein
MQTAPVSLSPGWGMRMLLIVGNLLHPIAQQRWINGKVC